MKILLGFYLLLLSFPVLADWNLKAECAFEGVLQEINQKVKIGQTYTFNNKNLIFIVKVEESDKENEVSFTMRIDKNENGKVNEFYAFAFRRLPLNKPLTNKEDRLSYSVLVTEILE